MKFTIDYLSPGVRPTSVDLPDVHLPVGVAVETGWGDCELHPENLSVMTSPDTNGIYVEVCRGSVLAYQHPGRVPVVIPAWANRMGDVFRAAVLALMQAEKTRPDVARACAAYRGLFVAKAPKKALPDYNPTWA